MSKVTKKGVTLESLNMRDYTKVVATHSMTEPLREYFKKIAYRDMLNRSAIVEKLLIDWMYKEGYLIKVGT